MELKVFGINCVILAKKNIILFTFDKHSNNNKLPRPSLVLVISKLSLIYTIICKMFMTWFYINMFLLLFIF